MTASVRHHNGFKMKLFKQKFKWGAVMIENNCPWWRKNLRPWGGGCICVKVKKIKRIYQIETTGKFRKKQTRLV